MISRSPPSFSINSCRLPEAKPRGGRLGLRSPELARTARFQKRSRPVRPGMSRGTHPDIRILTTRQRTHDDAWHISSTVLIARDLLSLTHSDSLIHLSLRHHSTTPCLCAHPAKRGHQHSRTPPSSADLVIIHPRARRPCYSLYALMPSKSTSFTRHSIVTHRPASLTAGLTPFSHHTAGRPHGVPHTRVTAGLTTGLTAHASQSHQAS